MHSLEANSIKAELETVLSLIKIILMLKLTSCLMSAAMAADSSMTMYGVFPVAKFTDGTKNGSATSTNLYVKAKVDQKADQITYDYTIVWDSPWNASTDEFISVICEPVANSKSDCVWWSREYNKGS